MSFVDVTKPDRSKQHVIAKYVLSVECLDTKVVKEEPKLSARKEKVALSARSA